MPKNSPTTPSVKSPTYVTIFGAGVAGLTAAHELVERGFRVQVWEPQSNDRFPERGCDIGGLARTQWSRAHWPEWMDPSNEPLPRVGKRAYELRRVGVRWTGSGPRTSSPAAAGARPPMTLGPTRDEWSVKKVFAQLSEDTRLEKENFAVNVIARSLDSPHESLLDSFFELLEKAPEWTVQQRQGDAIVLARKNGPAMRMQVIFRDERNHRARLLEELGVTARFEFYYRPSWGVQTAPIEHLPQRFYFTRTAQTGKEASKRPLTVRALGAFGNIKFEEVVDELTQTVARNPGIEQFYVEVFRSDWFAGGAIDPRHDGWDLAFANQVVDLMQNAMKPPDTIGDPVISQNRERLDLCCQIDGRLVDITAVRLDVRPPGTPADADVALTFRVRERWFPGEHGYRFFPSFYWHLFDTMARTPILVPQPKSPLVAAQERSAGVDASDTQWVESGRTALDSIVDRPATIDASQYRKKPFVFSRRPIRSVSEVMDRLAVILAPRKDGGLGLSDREGVRVSLHALKYMTSCVARRETEYETISWAKFVDLDSFSPDAQFLISNFPKALVAMEARESDARTMGSVGTQLMIDQVNDAGRRDGALDGPTSEVWLDHWRRYLESQGVEFVHGRLLALDVVDGIIWPRVECYEPTYPDIREDGSAPLWPGYFVLALPAVEVGRIAKDFRDRVSSDELPHRDLDAASNIQVIDNPEPNPQGGFKHYCGLQYYFWEDVYWADGHTYYPESPWAITTVSQTRRWLDRPDWEHGYRGVLSVILGRWNEPGVISGKPAWECTPDEIAQEVWEQIRAGLGQSKRLPYPVFWHIDENFRRVPAPDLDKKKQDHDETAEAWLDTYPYQIQAVGLWRQRPGALRKQDDRVLGTSDQADDEGDDVADGYSVNHGVVLAGTYTKTFTRVTSMEAANESARHAVNAILRDSASLRSLVECDIFPIEERELPDLRAARLLDRKLFERGLPHAFEILDFDLLVKELGTGSKDDPLNAGTLIRRALELVMRGNFSAPGQSTFFPRGAR